MRRGRFKVIAFPPARGISEARPELSPGGPGNFRSEEFPTAAQRCCGFAVWWKHLNQYLVCFPMDVGGRPIGSPPNWGTPEA